MPERIDVGIVDYGLGNLRSVSGAVARLGLAGRITCQPDELALARHLILPGVGAFGDGMRNLHERGLVDVLNELVRERRTPILGICLGAELLARESTEFGVHEGLGWIDAKVVPIEVDDPSLRVPHVGWNQLEQVRESRLFTGVDDRSLFYFVHSFHVVCDSPEIVTGVTSHGAELVATFERDNIFGTQFHPEKSQLAGLKLLENFLTLC